MGRVRILTEAQLSVRMLEWKSMIWRARSGHLNVSSTAGVVSQVRKKTKNGNKQGEGALTSEHAPDLAGGGVGHPARVTVLAGERSEDNV